MKPTENHDEKSISIDVKNHIGKIVFEGDNHNSLNSKLLEKLVLSLKSLDKNPTVRVIILCSKGERSFSAGADLKELLQLENKEKSLRFFSSFAILFNTIRSVKKIVIGRIQGKSIGGAVGLAASCDYCFANNYASIKLSELSLGIGPFVIGPAVRRKIGLSAFSELVLNPYEFKTAEWALNHGLYNSISSNTENMDIAVEEFCQKLTSFPASSLYELKKNFWVGTENWDTLLMNQANISADLILNPETQRTLQNLVK